MARIGLTQLPRRVAEYTGKTAPTYRRCFDAAVNARIPASFENSRWSVDDGDVPQIAEALGMTVTPAATPAAPRRKTASAAA